MSDPSGLAPPPWWQRSKELLLGPDLLTAGLRLPALRGLPRGSGAPVLLIPGFGTGDVCFLLLRRFLVQLGHDARPARLGRVGDDVPALAERVAGAAEAAARETGQRAALVGWSIGGVLAREAARARPDAIRRVVTIGTPVEGGPSYTALAGRYSAQQLAAIRAGIEEANRVPITTPITAIWSPNDGIVTPQACIDNQSPDVEHVRVTSTHLGMGLDPTVWAIVARCLAEPDRHGRGRQDRRLPLGGLPPRANADPRRTRRDGPARVDRDCRKG
jgi:pimeloyl-ACP methyl ester carboxylesterase